MPATVDKRARKHLQAMDLSSYLTQYWRRTQRPMAEMVTPERVVGALHAAGIRPVLMGSYGLAGWRSEPRATLDVDVLVRKRSVRKAIESLKTAFPDLSVTDTPVVARFIDSSINKAVIDLMKPTQAVYEMVFRHVISAGKTHDVPDLEMALTSKFAAITSPHRTPLRKMQDAVDFGDMVKHNRKDIDMPKLCRMANKVYPDGAKEIRQLIADIDAGKTIHV